MELSRYVANARAARFNLQYAILKYVPSTTLSRAETSIVAEGRIKEVEDQRVRTEKAKGRGEGPRLLELNL